jgi:hypothetical protein
MASKNYPIFLLSVLGFIFAIGLLLFQATTTEASQAFIRTGEFAVWLFLIGVSCVVMFTSLFILAGDLRKLWKYSRSNRLDLGISTLLVTLLYLVPILFTRISAGSPADFPLVYHGEKISILYALGYICTIIPGVFGIWLIRQGLLDEIRDIQPAAEYLRRYDFFREMLQRFIMILGILVTLVTLNTAALRDAVIAVGGATEARFPVIAVLTYGAYFTLMLLIIYLPTYNTLLEAGRRIRDVYAPIPEPNEENWDKVMARRKTLEESLQLHLSAQQHLQTSVFILAPLISGIFSVLLD